MNPIDALLEEHREIMVPIDELRRAVASLEARGDDALPAARPVLAAAARMMTTRLLDHARKEDEALFPALERTLDREAGPTAVMRAEHREIESQAHRFARTLDELAREHPAIVAGAGELSALATGTAGAARVAAGAAALIELLDAHFGKEEAILFPMARGLLTPGELDEVSRRMEAIGTP